MLGRNVCLAALIAVAVQVTAVHSASSICSKAEECYVNGSSSKTCDRTSKKCNRCLSEKESDSFWSTLGAWTEYNCYAYDDDGECPSGTTECPATLTTSNDNESSTGSAEAGSSEESSKSTSASSSTKKKSSSSSSSDSSKSTSTSTSTKKKKTTSSSTSSDSSSSSSTSKTTKPSTKKTTKPATKSSYSSSSDASAGDASSASASNSSSSESASASASNSASSSTSRGPAGSSGSEDVRAKTSSVSTTVAPTTTATSTKSTTSDSALNDNASKSSNTASADSGSGGSNLGLILGIVCGAAVLVAFAGFVLWKKKQDDEDSDDEGAFSPNKPAATRNMASLPSASSATTAYTAQPNNYYGKNNYEGNYNYGESGYSNNYPSTTSTQYDAGAGAGMVPASYGSPASIDIDAENEIRRTDSILGGTGVMSSTTSSQQTFSGGPSPANSDASRDVWGNEVSSSFRQKRTASNVSVEF